MEQIIQLNSGAKLSPHFTLGEMTTSNHKEVYNIPSHEAIANLKRLCGWLEVLRKRYNESIHPAPNPAPHMGGEYTIPSTPLLMGGGEFTAHRIPLLVGGGDGGGGDKARLQPIIINSGYRSPQLNKKIGGAPTSNHLTGCAADIRVSGMEQAIRYAAILLDYSQESHQEFDELLIERNRYGAIWVHFAVRPSNNRRKISFIQT